MVRGTAYFIDGYGTAFMLAVDGKQTVVTKFPIGLDQQDLYKYSSPTVAVGPNGLIAISGQTHAANQSQTSGEWRGPNGAGSLPANFLPEGWIDALTVFGLLGEGNSAGHNGDAALLRIGPAQQAKDLGIKGDFVGGGLPG